MSLKFYFITVYSDLINDRAELNSSLSPYLQSFVNAGGKEISSPEEVLMDFPLVYFMATGGTEKKMQVINRSFEKKHDATKFYLFAHPGNNSLPASLESLAYLKQIGKKGQILFLNEANKENVLREFLQEIETPGITSFLKNDTLGLVGSPSSWLTASSPKPETIKKKLGLDLVCISLDELMNSMAGISDEKAKHAISDFSTKAKGIVEPSEHDLIEAGRVYLALLKLVQKYDLTALSLRCFDLLSIPTTGCFALSKLNDEGILAGCEGDIISLLGMVYLKNLSDSLPWMANPSEVFPDTGIIKLAHCTVPVNNTDSYIIRSHFESGKGVGIQGDVPVSPVTLFRLSGDDFRTFWTCEGEIIPSDFAENLCRTQVLVKVKKKESLLDLLENPLGNHIVMIPGKWEEIIKGSLS